MPERKLPTTGEQTERPGVFVKTFGCQMNEYDSEKMLQLLSPTYRPVSSAEEADVVIVNTCSVRDKAEHKLFSILGKYAELKKDKPNLILGVGGCVAQQEGDQIAKRNRSVDFVVGTHNLSLIPSLVESSKTREDVQIAVDYRDEWEELPDEFDALPQVDGAQLGKFGLHGTPVRALVAIQRGCDKMCTYCVVPTTRGSQVSRSIAEIKKEVRLKVRLGAKEVLLLGQTVNSYGIDLSPRVRFEQLICELAEIDGLERIRFTSPHPAEVKKEFIELYGSVPQLCPQIHLPLQSGNDRVLKAMNRNYRTKRYLEIVDALYQRCPEIAISTDIIVGFPTETEAEFEDTLEIMRRVRYATSYSFKYSPRPNTVALGAYRPEEHLPEEVQQDRLLRLQSLQDDLCLEFNAKFLGKEVEVLVEGSTKKLSSTMRGRIPQNTLVELLPEDVAALEAHAGHSRVETPSVGDLVTVRVTYSGPHFLRGVCLGEERETSLPQAVGD